ncbi:fructose-bisphosphate aldolase [Eurytemora carolleeae]|uniref:fructose-bisphosphate aldolase n=1 Tax=Eurytemora carolleeae TaxID=1294199 RepID=UPI000C77C51E|nr:fructose-bisphosphate aldolase [Eurytemora carolleeae]|eukprot:XP_023343758.1 fructose-bisphosphate aldolase-like [Eurytemora affinis]
MVELACTEFICYSRSICKPGCGILAADETPLAMQDRFKHLGIDNTEENRRRYRQLLFSCPKDQLTSLSAVILQSETLYQKTDDGRPIIEVVKDLGIVPGITLDKGWISLGSGNSEVFTQGLDGLDKRCEEYASLGCKFAKWRMVVNIGDHIPTYQAILEGARSTAMYAKIAQRNGLVPIIEPDIGRGGEHTAQRCLQEHLLREISLFNPFNLILRSKKDIFEDIFILKALADYHIYLEGTLLKPNMVTSGLKCPEQATPEEVAELTMQALTRHVPPAVPGIFFLSGGQSEKMSTDNLEAINKQTGYSRPWMTSFCFGRALQDSCREAWMGKDENIKAAQEKFLIRVSENGKAAKLSE